MNSLENAISIIDVGLRVLAARALVFLALTMTFALACWAMWAGTWISAAVAGGFGVTIFLPVLARTLQGGTHASPE